MKSQCDNVCKHIAHYLAQSECSVSISQLCSNSAGSSAHWLFMPLPTPLHLCTHTPPPPGRSRECSGSGVGVGVGVVPLESLDFPPTLSFSICSIINSQGAGSSFDSSWVRRQPRGREEHSLFSSPKELESLGPKGPEISLLPRGS